MYPHERSLVKRLQNDPFVIIGVNSDADVEALQETLKEEEITWRSFHDGPPGGPIATAWNVQGWPTLYLVDHEGVIRNHWLGGPDAESLDATIDKLVAAAKAAAAD